MWLSSKSIVLFLSQFAQKKYIYYGIAAEPAYVDIDWKI